MSVQTSNAGIAPVFADRQGRPAVQAIWRRIEPLVSGSAAIAILLHRAWRSDHDFAPRTRIKQVIDFPLASRSPEEDPPAAPEFSRLRHEVWSLVCDKFRRAEILERHRASRAGA